MKAILIPEPRVCGNCKIYAKFYDRKNLKFVGWCPLLGREIESWLKPISCPLKDLPEKRDLEMAFNNDFSKGCACGWNDCIDEIMGEEE